MVTDLFKLFLYHNVFCLVHVMVYIKRRMFTKNMGNSFIKTCFFVIFQTTDKLEADVLRPKSTEEKNETRERLKREKKIRSAGNKNRRKDESKTNFIERNIEVWQSLLLFLLMLFYCLLLYVVNGPTLLQTYGVQSD